MKNIIYSFICVLTLLTFAGCAYAAGIMDIQVEDRQETIVLTLKRNTSNKVFTVSHPDRLVVDVPSLPEAPALALPRNYRGNLIKAVRFGQFDSKTSRFVFELTQPVRVLDVSEEGAKLVIKVKSTQDKDTASSKASGSKGAVPVIEESEVIKPKNNKDNSDKQNKRLVKKKSQKPVIVIDPGHGGVDPGAISSSGVDEKNTVLAYAKALKARLLKTGRYQVRLTREDDTFIILRKRVEIARKAHADLFISLHADSASEIGARGLSVYTVSEQASDREAEALAARENKADVLAGIDLSNERQDVAGILISLAERDTMNRSALLASFLVDALDNKVQLLPNSHRFAGFAVLKAPDIPSVLIEIGFLSHPVEEKLLQSKAYREKIVGGIASGIDAYLQEERRMSEP